MVINNRRSSSKKWFLASLIIGSTIFAMSWLVLDQYSVYFYTPEEVWRNSEDLKHREIRVGGMVKEASTNWEAMTTDLFFILSDMKGVEIPVAYRGAPPDLFKENSGVVVEGFLQLKDGQKYIKANKLMVKHSEEYKVPGDKVDHDEIKMLQKSIIKKS